ncbi:hypothetical protein I876_00165 [Alteromonas mediterranea U7]|nr:hypothetical protein I876_00165 [Alteromonas mediterranea U7]
MLYIEAATFLSIRLTEFSKVDSNQLYAVNATANQFFPIKRKPPNGGFFASGRNKIMGSESELCPPVS